jgi:hypothetical protein
MTPVWSWQHGLKDKMLWWLFMLHKISYVSFRLSGYVMYWLVSPEHSIHEMSMEVTTEKLGSKSWDATNLQMFMHHREKSFPFLLDFFSFPLFVCYFLGISMTVRLGSTMPRDGMESSYTWKSMLGKIEVVMYGQRFICL